jgi:hypothetical protein
MDAFDCVLDRIIGLDSVALQSFSDEPIEDTLEAEGLTNLQNNCPYVVLTQCDGGEFWIILIDTELGRLYSCGACRTTVDR